MITQSPNNSYIIGQKIILYSQGIGQWSLDSSEIITSNDLAIIEDQGVKTIDEIEFNYCKIKLISAGDFYVRFNTDTFTTTIYGLDTKWVAKQLGLWGNDVGTLCTGKIGYSQKINKWSIFKPIRSSSLVLGGKDKWLNKDLFTKDGAGMYINLWNGFSSTKPFLQFLEDSLKITDLSWVYLEPRGYTFKEYYRLNDFQGYTNLKNDCRIITNQSKNIEYHYADSENSIVNKDSFYFEDIQNDQVLSFSDILAGDIELGDYFLIAYVIDTVLNRHFFKVINKLSDCVGEVEIPLSELYLPGGLLYTTKYAVGNPLIKYYFLGSNATIGNWVEVVSTYNDLLPMYYAPATVPRIYNYLLSIFRNALTLPIEKKNYKSQNRVISVADVKAIIENGYTQDRNIHFDVNMKDINNYQSYTKLFIPSETVSTIIKATSQEEGEMIFTNCYNTDCITWDIGNTGEINKWYRPNSEFNTIIKFSELFSDIDEEDWVTIQNKITIIEENIVINFYNETSAIRIRYEGCKPLDLINLENGVLLSKNDEIFKFKNLNTYCIKIFHLDPIVDIYSNNDRLTVIDWIEEDDYILLTITINIGNGYYDANITPLNIYIS